MTTPLFPHLWALFTGAACLGTLALAAARPAAAQNPTPPATVNVPPLAQQEGPWYSVKAHDPLDNNVYTIYNNAWGDSHYRAGWSDITYDGNGGGVDWTASWSWPKGSHTWVCGYPECTLTVNDPLSTLKSVRSLWDYTLSLDPAANNAYDVAYDIYVKDGVGGTPSNTEIMIWTDYTGTGPLGSVYQKGLSFAGRTWDLHYHNSSTPVWSYVLVGRPMTRVDLDLAPFLQHLASLHTTGVNIYDSSGRLRTIDYGVEMHTGTGSLKTTRTQTNFSLH